MAASSVAYSRGGGTATAMAAAGWAGAGRGGRGECGEAVRDARHSLPARRPAASRSSPSGGRWQGPKRLPARPDRRRTAMPAPRAPPAVSPDDYARAALRVAACQLAEATGYGSARASAADALGDVAARYVCALGRAAKAYSEAAGRGMANVSDVVRRGGDGAAGGAGARAPPATSLPPPPPHHVSSWPSTTRASAWTP